jgi:hypothetical protein
MKDTVIEFNEQNKNVKFCPLIGTDCMGERCAFNIVSLFGKRKCAVSTIR